MAREVKMSNFDPVLSPLVAPPAALPLDRALLLRMHALMVQSRCLEDRLIALYKSGHGYFWIGGPGEEAFNVPLGLLVKKGAGPDFDYCHFHYRQWATFLAMGEEPLGAIRQMRSTALDPYSFGRNFSGHFTKKAWNVAPVTSPIEVQYVMAVGTALAQRRHGGDGITIVTGGDAGTAEGDFASALVWASRPGHELPLLLLVTNNQFGISTPTRQVQAVEHISDRAKAYGMRSKTIDGNDPIASYLELQEAMHYVRTQRRPFLLEANVSRLYGHSSASGANAVPGELDCLPLYEDKLVRHGLLTAEAAAVLRERHATRLADLARAVKEEPLPSAADAWEYVYAGEGRTPPLPE
jgi:2-oxoisovalerate dehydrogenase E1 component alpha subunit